MSIGFDSPDDATIEQGTDIHLQAPGLPAARHPTEADLFSRQTAMPGHDQSKLESAHVAIIGCGGLGSWSALVLARMGVRRLTLVDPDRFDRTNAPRQLLFSEDLGQNKAHALAHNLVPHMTNAGEITACAVPFADLANRLKGVSVVLVGVDNNCTRLEAAAWSLQGRTPAIFFMLSRDGLRVQVFLQRPGGPCLSCVLPNMDAESAAPCAAASLVSCFLAGAHAIELTVRVLARQDGPTWRETSLDGTTERTGAPERRRECSLCR